MKTKHYRLQWLDGDEWYTDQNKYYTLEDAKVALEYHKMQYTHLEARIVRVVVKTKVKPIIDITFDDLEELEYTRGELI